MVRRRRVSEPVDLATISKFSVADDFAFAPEQSDSLRIDPQVLRDLEASGIALMWATHELRGAPMDDGELRACRLVDRATR
jgi:hypothetical protein